MNKNAITTDSNKPVNLTKAETYLLTYVCSIHSAICSVFERIVFIALMLTLAYGGSKIRQTNIEQDIRLTAIETQLTNIVQTVQQ